MGFYRHSYALLGVKHVGKTTIGTALAEKLGADFVDLDQLILRRAEHEDILRHGVGAEPPIRTVYRALGAEVFAQWEKDALRDLPATIKDRRAVLATGGGVGDHSDTMALLASLFGLLYLDDDPLVLYQRATRGGLPAFLDPTRPKDHFLEIAQRRGAVYREFADLVIDLRNCDRQESLARILELVR